MFFGFIKGFWLLLGICGRGANICIVFFNNNFFNNSFYFSKENYMSTGSF